MPQAWTSTCTHLQKSHLSIEAIVKHVHKIQSSHMDTKAQATHMLDNILVSASPCSPDNEPHVCLQCNFVGELNAMSPSKTGFIKHTFQTDHFLGYNLIRCRFYCTACRDYMYDRELEKAMDASKMDTATSNETTLRIAKGGKPLDGLIGDRKRQRDQSSKEWLIEFGHKHFKSTSANSDTSPLERSLPSTAQLGLRGLYNMGNTCFMSSILQSLLHNPMVRNYFLADSHNSSLCKDRRKRTISSMGATSDYCLGCDMDDFFSMMYSTAGGPSTSGNSTASFSRALVPDKLLYSMWKHAHHLAGYEQQDAHEFLMGLLDGIHSHTHCNARDGGSSPRIGAKGASLCNCVVHQTFSGVLASQVTCSQCHTVSTAYDPFFDLSLPMDDAVAANAGTTERSLKSCLNRFTHPEQLVADEKARCGKCQTYQDSVKQLSIHTLPNVLCVHFKRFDALKRKKINHFVQFPAHGLDISQYMEKSRISSDGGIGIYDLFAVINHHGTINSGHYTNFARCENQWYKFNDSSVTKVDEEIVLRSEAYLLFYIKRNLCYSSAKHPHTVDKPASAP